MWTGQFERWLDEQPGPEQPSSTTGAPEPKAFIDAGWSQDIQLATLLEERATWEQTRNPDNARKLREFARSCLKSVHTHSQQTATEN
jgi:hypothetical protein